MKRIALAIMTLVVACAAAQIGCMDRQPAPVCPVPTELKADDMQPGGFDGVDLLVMVDNSQSMTQEQLILSTSFFPLVNSLANPINTEFVETDWPYDPAEELRLAVVTSNMGFSSNGTNNDAAWPGDMVTECQGFGDNGRFQTDMPASVSIATGVIPCDVSAAQCPTGWTCDGISDATFGVGTCTSATPTVTCPALPAVWAETTDEVPNPSFPIQASCLAQQGIGGCGFEQQLASVARALGREDQKEFIHDSHLLAILVVSDEEDCSMENGAGLFAQEEVSNQSLMKVNIACGENPSFLFAPGDFYQTFIDAKSPNGVVFAAIAGVPYEGAQAVACQGTGDVLGSCLDQADMQLVPELVGTSWFYHPACTRSAGDPPVEVTKAYPGRRYVELANGSFQNMSYVYSICNADWSQAMMDISRLIAAQMAGTCYKKPLDWDPVDKVAKCNVVVEYRNEGEECDSDLYGDVEPVIKKDTSPEGEEEVLMYCPIPKLPAEQDCADISDTQAAAIASEFGWYYCENMTTEDFSEACDDHLDNDGDGAIDCEDTQCADCKPCPDATGNNCSKTCKYVVMLTETAKAAVAGRQVAVQCLQQFSFEDRNCQEDTLASCTDSLDNDGNGIWDCANEADGETDDSDEKGHQADPNCCPMTGESGQTCDLEPEGALTFEETCPEGDSIPYTGGYPDACLIAAQRNGCNLP